MLTKPLEHTAHKVHRKTCLNFCHRVSWKERNGRKEGQNWQNFIQLWFTRSLRRESIRFSCGVVLTTDSCSTDTKKLHVCVCVWVCVGVWVRLRVYAFVCVFVVGFVFICVVVCGSVCGEYDPLHLFDAFEIFEWIVHPSRILHTLILDPSVCINGWKRAQK